MRVCSPTSSSEAYPVIALAAGFTQVIVPAASVITMPLAAERRAVACTRRLSGPWARPRRSRIEQLNSRRPATGRGASEMSTGSSVPSAWRANSASPRPIGRGDGSLT